MECQLLSPIFLHLLFQMASANWSIPKDQHLVENWQVIISKCGWNALQKILQRIPWLFLLFSSTRTPFNYKNCSQIQLKQTSKWRWEMGSNSSNFWQMLPAASSSTSFPNFFHKMKNKYY